MLDKEAAPLGIKVTIVEPGPFRTDWAGRSLRPPAVAVEDYAAPRHSAPGHPPQARKPLARVM